MSVVKFFLLTPVIKASCICIKFVFYFLLHPIDNTLIIQYQLRPLEQTLKVRSSFSCNETTMSLLHALNAQRN